MTAASAVHVSGDEHFPIAVRFVGAVPGYRGWLAFVIDTEDCETRVRWDAPVTTSRTGYRCDVHGYQAVPWCRCAVYAHDAARQRKHRNRVERRHRKDNTE